MSGLSHTPGKRAWVHSPPRVRIPPSPPGQKKNRSAQRSAVFSFVESPASWSVAGSRTYLYALAGKPAAYENAVYDCVFIWVQIASTEVVSSASNATISPLGFPNPEQSPLPETASGAAAFTGSYRSALHLPGSAISSSAMSALPCSSETCSRSVPPTKAPILMNCRMK